MTQQPPSSDPNNDEQTQPPARRGGFVGWLLAFSIVAIVFSIANQPSGGVEIKSWETFLAYVEGNNQQVTVPSSDTEGAFVTSTVKWPTETKMVGCGTKRTPSLVATASLWRANPPR